MRVRANGAQSLVAGGTAAMFIVAMERTARTLRLRLIHPTPAPRYTGSRPSACALSIKVGNSR